MITMHKYLILIIASLILFCTGCDKDSDDKIKNISSRPVTILQLENNDFVREINLTGSVNLYREEKVGFEVNGRILAVEELGKELEGPAYDENDELVRPGKIIATMDDTRYRLKVDALRAPTARLAGRIAESLKSSPWPPCPTSASLRIARRASA